MIKIFRRIRQRLILEGRMGKYIKYGLGEILLVVIGILIALQINNWNERNKLRAVELKLLIELKEDLLETQVDLFSDISKSRALLKYTDSIFQLANAKQVIKIDLNYIYEVPLLFPKLSAYKSIQADGVNIIRNDRLREMVTNFYELQLERVKFGEAIIEEMNIHEIKPYLNEYANPTSTCPDCKSLFKLYDSEEDESRFYIYTLSETDKTFVHFLNEKFFLIRGLRKRYEQTNDMIEEMILAINDEIKKEN